MDGWVVQLKKSSVVTVVCGISGMWYEMAVDFLYQLDGWACSCRCVHMMTYHTRYRVTYFDLPCTSTSTSTSNRDKIGMYHRIGTREQQEQQGSKAPPHLPIETAPLSSTPAP